MSLAGFCLGRLWWIGADGGGSGHGALSPDGEPP
jgi:hypothetical protein